MDHLSKPIYSIVLRYSVVDPYALSDGDFAVVALDHNNITTVNRLIKMNNLYLINKLDCYYEHLCMDMAIQLNRESIAELICKRFDAGFSHIKIICCASLISIAIRNDSSRCLDILFGPKVALDFASSRYDLLRGISRHNSLVAGDVITDWNEHIFMDMCITCISNRKYDLFAKCYNHALFGKSHEPDQNASYLDHSVRLVTDALFDCVIERHLTVSVVKIAAAFKNRAGNFIYKMLWVLFDMDHSEQRIFMKKTDIMEHIDSFSLNHLLDMMKIASFMPTECFTTSAIIRSFNRRHAAEPITMNTLYELHAAIHHVD